MSTTSQKLPSIIQFKDEEIEEYAEKVKDFRSEDMPEDQFMAFRLRLGVYGQRQPDVQMIRIKIPGGLLHSDQMDALGEITEKYASFGKSHITTRECVQVYQMKLEEATQVMRILQSVGLSTKEACGNTVRNVVACPMAGVDPQQAFDIQPYMGAFARNFVRRDFTFTMPRKIKTAFSCGEHDCAVTPFHDLGFIARVREENGETRKGFKITVGGGTSIQPLMAETLYEFVPVEEFLMVCEALLRVFNRTAWLRRNKMKARIKVLIHKEGIDSFRQKVEEELKEEWAKDYGSREDLLFFDDELADVPTPPNDYKAGGQDDADFLGWKATNVTSQTESGYNFVTIKVPQGDLRPGQFRALGEIARTHASSRLRTTSEQNLMLRWVPDAYLHDVYQGLKAIELAESGVNRITDITACPGTDSCKMGITSTMGLSHALALTLKSPNGHTSLLEDNLVQQMHIKMSGCPNGCGRHHLADIGFQGAAMKGPTGAQVPSYELFVGGSYENADVRYGIRPRGKIPAKRIPEATFRVISYYRENRQEDEPFKDFAVRVGREPFEKIIADLGEVPTLGRDNIDLYVDYERTILYVMERGEGECGV